MRRSEPEQQTLRAELASGSGNTNKMKNISVASSDLDTMWHFVLFIYICRSASLSASTMVDASPSEGMSVTEALQFRKRRLAREGSNLSAASSDVCAVVDPYGDEVHDSDSENIFDMADQWSQENGVPQWRQNLETEFPGEKTEIEDLDGEPPAGQASPVLPASPFLADRQADTGGTITPLGVDFDREYGSATLRNIVNGPEVSLQEVENSLRNLYSAKQQMEDNGEGGEWSSTWSGGSGGQGGQGWIKGRVGGLKGQMETYGLSYTNSMIECMASRMSGKSKVTSRQSRRRCSGKRTRTWANG